MVGRSWSRIRSSYQSIRRTPTRLAIDSIETIKDEPTQTMPASSHLFATRTHTPILAKRDRPEREPIIERLPPLPVIHDMGLALAATNLREGREVFMTMAQAGDRCLLGHEAFSRARDAYPIQRAGAGIVYSYFGSNAILSHLGCIYGLHRLLQTSHVTQHDVASAFEAWIYAAKEDASRRGFMARGIYEAQIDEIFNSYNWKKFGSRTEDQLAPIQGTLRHLCAESLVEGSIATSSTLKESHTFEGHPPVHFEEEYPPAKRTIPRIVRAEWSFKPVSTKAMRIRSSRRLPRPRSLRDDPATVEAHKAKTKAAILAARQWDQRIANKVAGSHLQPRRTGYKAMMSAIEKATKTVETREEYFIPSEPGTRAGVLGLTAKGRLLGLQALAKRRMGMK